jgi:hypothetical protein
MSEPPDHEALANARLAEALLDQTETWNRLADLLPASYVPLLDAVFEELGRTRLMLQHVKSQRPPVPLVNGFAVQRTKAFRNPFDPSD